VEYIFFFTAGVLPREERNVETSQLNVNSRFFAPYIVRGLPGRDGRNGLQKTRWSGWSTRDTVSEGRTWSTRTTWTSGYDCDFTFTHQI